MLSIHYYFFKNYFLFWRLNPELNKQLRKDITDTKEVINGIKKQIKEVDDEKLSTNSIISKAKQEKEGIEGRIAQIKKLEETNKLYDYYLDALNKRVYLNVIILNKTKYQVVIVLV